MKAINKLIKYYLYQLINSIFFYVLGFGSIVGSILSILLPYYLRSNQLANSSFIISISYQVITIIFILYLSIKLFNENKHNLSDVKLLGKDFSRTQLFWSKFLVILICSNIISFFMNLIGVFTMLGLKVTGITIISIFMSNIIGLLINILVFIPILIILSLILGRIWSPIISLIAVMIAPISSLIGNFVLSNPHQSNNINKNINNPLAKVQYNKIYQFNQDNKKIDDIYAYNINYDQNVNNNLNIDIANSINHVDKWNFLLPGNITLATQQAIYSSMNHHVDLNDYLMYPGSLSRYVPTDFINPSSYFQTNNSYLITNMNDQDFFNKNSIDLENMLINSLKNIANTHNSIMKSPKEIDAIYNSLSSNNGRIWNISKLNQKQTNFIFDLIGKNDSNLFYAWYYNQYLLGNLSNIIEKISSYYSVELGKLINYLWFGNDTYFNLVSVSATNQILKKFQDELRIIYPINTVYKSDLMASEKNLQFISNNLVLIKESNIHLLCNEGTYQITDSTKFKTIFNIHKLDNQDDWKNYLTSLNIPTVSFIDKVYRNLLNLEPNLISLRLDNNSFDVRTFNQLFRISVEPYNSSWISSLIVELSLIVLFMTLAYYVNKKIKFA